LGVKAILAFTGGTAVVSTGKAFTISSDAFGLLAVTGTGAESFSLLKLEFLIGFEFLLKTNLSSYLLRTF